MKKNKKIGILAILVLVFSISIFGGIGLANRNQVKAATVEGISVLDEYSLGKVLTIPSAKIKVGDKTVDSEYAYIVFPSGKASDKSPVVLDEEGIYQLVYTATVDGEKVKASKNITVNKGIFKVGNESSSVYYGAHSKLPSIEGVVLSLVNNDTFIYEEIIDLSDNTKNDALIKFTMPTTEKGKADVAQLVIRFTDIYDENNYLEVFVKNVADIGDWALSQAYITAGANGQTAGGWENAPGGSIFHTNNDYGFPVGFGMAGVPFGTSASDILTLSYDFSENAMYADSAIYVGRGNMIADFNDIESFMNLWDGFATGEVRMSIRGVGYKAEAMNAVITCIDGDTPKQAVTTDSAPIIKVELPTEEGIPYAIVGKEYAIFNASAHDAHDGVTDVTAHVYYNYGKANQTVCNVENGKFVPSRSGVYTIVYTAIDNMWQTARKVIDVEAVEGEGLTVDVTDTKTKGYTGKSVVLFGEIICNNPSGNVTITVLVDGEEILPVNGVYSFVPLKDGAHTVEVKAVDYVKEEIYSYEYNSVRNYNPEIFGDVSLPKYIIQGEKFVFPALSGYDFSSGSAKEHTTKISVKENGGNEIAVDGNAYAPTQTGTLEVIYTVDVGGRSSKKSFTTEVVSVFEGEDLHIEKFFRPVSGNPEIVAGNNYISVISSGKATVEFINRVQVKDFFMTFVVSESKNKFSKINIYLTDTLDPSKQVKFTYGKNVDGSANFSVNDGASLPVDASFIDASRNFMLSFANGEVHGSATLKNDVTTYLDGRAYEGFSGNMAYLTIEMAGVAGQSELCIKNINRQSLNNSDKDRTAPQILIDAIFGDRTINDVITIQNGFAADVLSNYLEFTLKIDAPDGKPAVATDGTVMDGVRNDPTGTYQIALSSYGDYYIEYYAVDGYGREKTLSYYVNVLDRVAPEIKLSAAVRNARVGETIEVAKCTLTDNITKDVSVYICVEKPDGSCDTVVDGKFVANDAGEYTVRYMAWDDAGNYAFKSYTITVK